MVKSLIKLLSLPILWVVFSKVKKRNSSVKTYSRRDYIDDPKKQDLELYWDPEYAKVLEEWGKDSTWNEIQLILASLNGKVLDIACGTGITIKILSKYPGLELYGFD